MADCSICGEKIPEGSRTCPVCGSSADDFFPSATMLKLEPTSPAPAAPPGGSVCPACAKTYGPEHTDTYCTCGTELIMSESEPIPMAPIVDEIPMAPMLDEIPMAPFVEEEVPMAPILEDEPVEEHVDTAVKLRSVKPPPGTPCLVLYGPDRQPLQYFPLTKDATMIGRLDAVAGNFPDIDLDAWFDRATIRKISRQHALILRTRASASFALRPLVGNTGTQLERNMIQPMQDYPLAPGHRIILGGVIRFKFEIS
ncbi:MAG TPA: FHA domain-containing protein [Gemmataceae bacterium]|nr:FHA domain-containing protein [Gemmataceae bacterium]